jgi:GAF domain-containing protein
LADVSAVLATSLDSNHVHEAILQHVARIVPCDTAHIHAYRNGAAVTVGGFGTSHLPTGVRVALLADVQALFPLTDDLARPIVETRDVPGWRNIAPWTGTRELRSLLLLPLVVRGVLYGRLRVGSYTPGFYHETNFQVARAFAERIALALWNARLYDLEQRRARAAEPLAAMRSDFVASVSHEPRMPLTAALGYGELLQARWGLLSDGDRRTIVDHMVVAATPARASPARAAPFRSHGSQTSSPPP